MDYLPQEIINRIALYLERFPGGDRAISTIEQCRGQPSALPPYATISKQWKEAVEFITFHRLDIKSEDLGELQTTVSHNRRRYLRRLSYDISIPVFSEEQGRHEENRKGKNSDNETFTQALVDLFSILKQWEEAGLLPEMRLKVETTLEYLTDSVNFKTRSDSAYVALCAAERLPMISSVVYLQIKGNSRLRISPAVGPGIVAFLPSLKHISWEFGDEGEQADKVENRMQLAKMLGQARLPSCSAVDFNFYQESPEDHRKPSPSLLPPGALYDTFSASLRVLSQNLTSFVLSGYVDSTLFWPSSHETCSTPSWPSLKRLKIYFNSAALSGDWYFVGTPTEDSEEFLEHGNKKTLDPFLTAFAQATQRMPVLDTFMLECDMGLDMGFWEISYYAPGVKADWSRDWGDEDTDTVRRLYYCVRDVWRPDDFVSDTLQSIGQESHGSELIERFLERRSWSSDSAWSWL